MRKNNYKQCPFCGSVDTEVARKMWHGNFNPCIEMLCNECPGSWELDISINGIASKKMWKEEDTYTRSECYD